MGRKAAAVVPRQVVIDYAPRPAFMPFHNRPHRWSVLVAHRRAGKTVAAINDLIRAALMCRSPNPLFGYVAPFRSQAKSVAWDYIKRYSRPVQKDVNEGDLVCELITGAKIRLFGADNADAMRGLGFDGIIMDEYGDFRPSVWGHVIRPALSDKQGWGVFMGTPKGKNQFWDVYDRAINDPKEWFCLTLKASDSKILPPTELEAARAQLSEDQFLQEFECSFEAAILGAYYGVEMRQLNEQGQITEVNYDPSLTTYTAWDLGHSDDTAVWWFQVVRNEIHVIDYYSVSGASPQDLAEVVKERQFPWQGKLVTPHYGKHFLPHDANAKTFASGGKSTIEQLGALMGGMSNFSIVPSLSVQDGIQAVRLSLPKCWFDAKRCKEGIECLRQYEREYNEDTKSFRLTPKHNWASHGADAFRMLAISWREESNVVPFDTGKPLIVGPGNTVTLNEMWAARKQPRRARI